MGRRWGALRKFMVDRSALITSWASLVVASAALGLTIYNARLDRQYKELSVRPSLDADVDGDSFQYAIINSGIGPAQVRRLATRFKGSCTYLDEANDPNLDKAITPIVYQIGDYFVEPLKKYLKTSIWESVTPRIHMSALTPGQIIPVGGRVTLFQLDDDQLKTIRDNLFKLGTDQANEVIQDFIHRGFSIPFYPEYCSLTGYFCSGGERIRRECK